MSENTVTIDHAALEARFDKALRALLDAYENRQGEAFDNAHDDLEMIGGLLLETVKEQAARIAELEKALDSVLDLVKQGDFRNGVTDDSGGSDEGVYYALKIADESASVLGGAK